MVPVCLSLIIAFFCLPAGQAVNLEVTSGSKLVRRARQNAHGSKGQPPDKARNFIATTPSRNTLLKSRRSAVVPGHIALPSMVEVTHGGKEGTSTLSCDQVFERARDIAVDYKTHLTASGAAAPAWVTQLLTNINNRVKSEVTTAAFSRVLDGENLSDGLTSGHPWTIADHTVWIECNNGVATWETSGEDPLETHKFIGSTPICQGDELCLDGAGLLETSGSLLDMTARHRRGTSNIWPITSGTEHEVSYCFASSVDQKAQDAINAAVADIEKQVPCLKFKPSNPTGGENKFPNTVQENCETVPSIIIQTSQEGCWSLIGKVSGVGAYASSSQPINIGAGCEFKGIAAHEFGHAIGMLHEMSRNDREKYVSIMTSNIAAGMETNFNNHSAASVTTDFDFLSLMMYGAYAFSTNGELTIKPHQQILVSYMGQREGFSELDVELMGNMYGCVDQISPTTRNKDLSIQYLSGDINTGFEGKCEDKETTGYVTADDKPMLCPALKIHCAHDTLGAEIRGLCPVSCFMCLPGADKQEDPLPETPAPTAPKQQSGARSRFLTPLTPLILMGGLVKLGL